MIDKESSPSATEETESRVRRSSLNIHSCNEEFDEDPLIDFSPLDAHLSYYISDLPPTLEVMRTEDMASVRTFIKQTNGIPFDDRITTSHVGKSAKKITRKHAQYALAAGMMLGIREVIGGVEGLYEADLDVKDNPAALSEDSLFAECKRVLKYTFPHSVPFEGGKPLPYSYDFKAYAPLVFARIRSAFGIEKNLFLHSICGNFNFIEFMSNAKTGNFFFFSHDGRYMIKTQTSEECKFLQGILPNYYQYFMDNPHSFLTHFYGMYRVRIKETNQQIHFCIMKSVFYTEKEIHKIWDLKGSTKGRRAKPGESVMKDLDILDEGRKLQIGAEKKKTIMSQLRKDATLMARLGIMDYSLLLGVHEEDKDENITSDERDNPRRKATGNNIISRSINLDQGNIDPSDSSPFSNEDTPNNSHADSSANDFRRDDESLSSTGNNSSAANAYCVQALSPNVLSEISDGQSPLHASTPSPIRLSIERDGIESYSQITKKKEKYFCGIIDILQSYNARKWGETVVRKAAGNAASEISCVDPETYANRFVQFISNLIE